jgi:hypothetical protein
MTVFSTPNKARNTLALRTPFSAHWILTSTSQKPKRERRVRYSTTITTPTDASVEPKMLDCSDGAPLDTARFSGFDSRYLHLKKDWPRGRSFFLPIGPVLSEPRAVGTER